jgi:ABC-2 type transport system ATP-binding protein
MMRAVVEVAGLCRRFGKATALADVTFEIPVGTVFGLVGENGAGKTTLIKHLLGLFRAQQGTVRVFGLDPVLRPAEVLARVGYLSEDRDSPDWMRVGELMRYSQAFYPRWDPAFAEQLRDAFELDAASRIRSLSRGQRARAGLLVAVAHRPELLVLDEPSSGLDALVRRDILAAMIRTVADEGRTVIFSSHLLDEVERVADQVAFLRHGHLELCGSLENLLASHQVCTVRFAAPRDVPPETAGVISWQGDGREWVLLCNGGAQAVVAALAQQGGEIVEQRQARLEDLFLGRGRQSALL